MRKRIILISVLIIICVSSCSATGTDTIPPGSQDPPDAAQSTNPASRMLTIFAAASLTGVFQEIGRNFEAANPGVQVTFNFAGSQILRTQLEQGALADVYASADHKNMDLVVMENLISAKAVHDFATNSLIVILPASNPGHITGLTDLARLKLKIVLADASVPAGNYARQILVKINQDAAFGSDYNEKVLANVVSNETDVKQVVTKVELGEADAGIVYASDAVAAPDLITLPIPEKFNVIARYPIAVLSNAPEGKLASSFVDYVLSPDGQALLQKWGFNPANH
jgi:molybdate transport system substrate-binding protein